MAGGVEAGGTRAGLLSGVKHSLPNRANTTAIPSQQLLTTGGTHADLLSGVKHLLPNRTKANAIPFQQLLTRGGEEAEAAAIRAFGV